MLQRIVGMSVEEFNSRLMSKLDNLADKILDRMLETVDETPLNSLGFNLSVAIDKRQRLQGINATQAANVNIQVNNYGGMSKEEIIAKLMGKPVEPKPALPAVPAAVELEPLAGSEPVTRKSLDQEESEPLSVPS